MSANEPTREDVMADLRVFLEHAAAMCELETIEGADPELEIGALFELSHEHLYPPVLLFRKMKGCNPAHRILSNVRVAKFMVGDLTMEALKAFRARPKSKREPIPPREVDSGPIFENVISGSSVNIEAFPTPRWHSGDGGRYIGTECVVITKDPDSDWVNLGTYRVMVHDETTLGVFIEPGKNGDMIRRKYWARGEPCPMIITFGQAPILGTVASTQARPGVSEYNLAGGRIGRPVDIVRGRLTGLPMPATAEIAFEGYMPPREVDQRPEGPFGEWPGYYATHTHPEAVMHVKCIYHRDDPIMIGQPPTKPNYPGRQIKLHNVAALWDAIEAAGVPEVRGVWKLQGGGSRFINVISIKQLHSGHAKMAGLVAAGCGPGAYMTRLVIVVDDDIDITNPAEVMWAVATRWDPKTQTDIIDGCWSGHIDPLLPPEKRAVHDLTNSRMIIYAVRPYHWKDDFPQSNEVERDYADEIRRKWQDRLGFLKR
ncbi:MAG: UbiD-like subunit of potential (de) carboxylase [Pseudomonadota bacterium]|jgi:4-hydroxy-3-polyprenylbenzoate decarboxylase